MKVVVCGLAPLPPESSVQSPATGARTWQLARALAGADHEVSLVLRRIPGAYGEEGAGPRTREVEGLDVIDAAWEQFIGDRWLRRTVRRLAPDLVVGACLHGSHDACRLGPRIPVWADLFGDPMAEAQAQAVRVGNNRPLLRRWPMLRRILGRADRLSTVSGRQRLATVGELAAVGRLSLETAEEELVHAIPFSIEDAPPRLPGPVVRGRLVGEEEFVLLWSGSYNVWTDAETLFAGVDVAMRENPKIHFVSTGGSVPGYDDETYRRFVGLVASSPRRERFHLLGWVQRERATTLLYEADLGVVIERRFHEGELGTKTRIVEWMAAGLPVLASDVSELPSHVAEAGCGFVVPPGDARALSRILLELARDRGRLERTSKAARTFLAEELAFSNACAPLLDWVQRPEAAADRAGRASTIGRMNWLPWRGGLSAAALSPWERVTVLAEPLFRRSGLKRWWMRRKLRSFQEKER